MEFIIRNSTGGLKLSYGHWYGCAWWEFYTMEHNLWQ